MLRLRLLSAGVLIVALFAGCGGGGGGSTTPSSPTQTATPPTTSPGGTSTPIVPITAGNLLKNGSFELGTNPGVYLPLNPGSQAINNWTVISSDVPGGGGGGIDYYGTGWVCSDGNRCLDLNGTPGVGGVFQDFNTTPGQKYTVSFYMAGHPSGFLQRMRVSAAGQEADFSFQSGTNSNNLGWQKDTWQFTAQTLQTRLQFESLQTGYTFGGPALDNVIVTTGTSTSIAGNWVGTQANNVLGNLTFAFIGITQNGSQFSGHSGSTLTDPNPATISGTVTGNTFTAVINVTATCSSTVNGTISADGSTISGSAIQNDPVNGCGYSTRQSVIFNLTKQ